VNNSRKESTAEQQERKNSRDLVAAHNRSNSSLHRKEPEELRNTFRIDMSSLIDREEFLQSTVGIGKHQFNYQYVIGKGGFGKVWSVEFKKNRKIYAMKEMMKTKIIGKKSITSVMNERLLLSTLKHPFIVNMNYAFQDREYLYLVMDLLNGGDLRYHIGRKRKFKEVEARFYIACIIVGLEYLHLNNIIHRDIKPENLVLDDRGYLRITDLGIARYMKPNNSADTSGTPGYMAPEVMCREDHSFPVDYYAVGVISYEFMLGRRPYFGKNRKEIRDQILSKQVQVKEEELPENWSPLAMDFVNKV
jgi:protein kinase A